MRIWITDRWEKFKGAAKGLVSCVSTREVNSDEPLEFESTEEYEKGDRVVWQDSRGRWHENIIDGVEEERGSSGLIYAYYCPSSALVELSGDYVEEKRPYDTSARTALTAALSGSRWTVGQVDDLGTASASLYHMSAWEALQEVVLAWGGEVEFDIEVSGDRITARRINLKAKVGGDTGRRFTYTKDLLSVAREVDEGNVVTALYGYGSSLPATGEDGSETGGFTRKITFGEVNEGKNWVGDEEALELWGRPDGKGGKAHVFGEVEFSECEDPAELLELTRAELAKRCVPSVTYKADVMAVQRAGEGFEGADAGDTVLVVDKVYDPPLRARARITKVKEDLLEAENTEYTFGNWETIGDVIASQGDGLKGVMGSTSAWDQAANQTQAYIEGILSNLNSMLNATGGYTYYTPGEGLITYDKPIDQNPTKALQIVGGGARIADSKKSDGTWDWRSVFVSGHVATELVTAANLIAGYIGSPGGGNYWNLDTGEFRLAASSANLDGRPIATADAVIESVDVEYASGASSETAPTSGWSTTAPAWQPGRYIWQRTKTVNQEGAASYSEPTCIQGAEGEAGIGVSGIVEQYYLSTSQTAPAGGSWSTAQPEWAEGRYIWTRSEVTWTDGSATHTDPVLAKAINGANQSASDAAKVATNYAEFVPGEGLVVGDMTAGTLGGNTLIKAEGMDIRDGQDALATFRKDSVSLGSSGQGSQVSLCGELVVDVTVGSDGRPFARIRGNGESGVTVTGPGDLPAMMSFFGLDGGSEPSGRQFGTVMAYAHTISVNKQASGGVAGGIYTLSDHMVYLDLVDVTALDSAFRPRMAMRGGFVQLQGRVVPSKQDAVVCDLSEYAWSLDIPPEGVNRNFICFGLLNGENFPVNVYLNHQGQILISNKPDFVDLSGVVVRNNGNLAGDYME